MVGVACYYQRLDMKSVLCFLIKSKLLCVQVKGYNKELTKTTLKQSKDKDQYIFTTIEHKQHVLRHIS